MHKCSFNLQHKNIYPIALPETSICSTFWRTKWLFILASTLVNENRRSSWKKVSSFRHYKGRIKFKAMKYCWKKSSVEVGKISVVFPTNYDFGFILVRWFSYRISEPTIETSMIQGQGHQPSRWLLRPAKKQPSQVQRGQDVDFCIIGLLGVSQIPIDGFPWDDLYVYLP